MSSTLAVPAASAVLLRDRPLGLEVLMLRRSPAMRFAPGAWVFPGGRVDPADLDGASDAAGTDPPRGADPPGADTERAAAATELAAARRAAARETAEEAGLTVDGADLAPLSRWCPPVEAPRRFRTWILVGRAPEQAVVVDGVEISEHRWLRPRDALAARDAGDLELLPPTWVTLWTLAPHATVADAVAAALASPPELFETQFTKVPGGLLAMWHGDEDYAEASGARHPGARHRLWMLDAGWRYERAA